MQLSRTDWLEQGLQLLSTEGPQHLKIDTLCHVLGVTKGSFYHHFKHHAAYVSALLEHWRANYTQQLIHAVAGIDDPQVRSQRLSELVYLKDMRPEVAEAGALLRLRRRCVNRGQAIFHADSVPQRI